MKSKVSIQFTIGNKNRKEGEGDKRAPASLSFAYWKRSSRAAAAEGSIWNLIITTCESAIQMRDPFLASSINCSLSLSLSLLLLLLFLIEWWKWNGMESIESECATWIDSHTDIGTKAIWNYFEKGFAHTHEQLKIAKKKCNRKTQDRKINA